MLKLFPLFSQQNLPTTCYKPAAGYYDSGSLQGGQGGPASMKENFDAFLSFHECLAQKLPQDGVASGKRRAVWPSESVLPLGAAGYVSATQGAQNRDLVQKEAAQDWPCERPREMEVLNFICSTS